MNCSTNVKIEETSTGESERSKLYFKKTRDIKLDKENLFSLNRQPIQVDESFKFDLNTNTKYLNVFMWTVQYLNKSTRKKNLLIGYVI